MRIKFNSIHLKEFVTINQSLIIGTHSEAAGILNFLTSSLGLSSPIYLIFQGEGYKETVFPCQRISEASLSFLFGISLFLPSFRKTRVTNLREFMLGTGGLNSQNLSLNGASGAFVPFLRKLSGEIYYWVQNIKMSESSTTCSKMETVIVYGVKPVRPLLKATARWVTGSVRRCAEGRLMANRKNGIWHIKELALNPNVATSQEGDFVLITEAL